MGYIEEKQTPPQLNYIQILFNDCGFNTTIQRREFLWERFKKSYASDLTKDESSRCISILKDLKSHKKGVVKDLAEDY